MCKLWIVPFFLPVTKKIERSPVHTPQVFLHETYFISSYLSQKPFEDQILQLRSFLSSHGSETRKQNRYKIRGIKYMAYSGIVDIMGGSIFDANIWPHPLFFTFNPFFPLFLWVTKTTIVIFCVNHFQATPLCVGLMLSVPKSNFWLTSRMKYLIYSHPTQLWLVIRYQWKRSSFLLYQRNIYVFC